MKTFEEFALEKILGLEERVRRLESLKWVGWDPAGTECEVRVCSLCGASVRWRGGHPIQYHDCKEV